MERLTIEILDKVLDVMETVEQCCDGGDSFELAKYEFLKKLKEYMFLEEQGRLLKLPCAVGDMVYRIEYRYTKCSKFGEEFDESSCYCCESECDSHKKYYINETKPQMVNWIVEHMKYFGKTVFLTHQAAMAKLKEMEGKE